MKQYQRRIYIIFMAVEIAVFIFVGIFAFMKYRFASADKVQSTAESTQTVQEEGQSDEKEDEKEEEKDTDTKKAEATTAQTAVDESVESKLETMTLEEKVSQLFIISPETLTGADLVEQAGEQTKQAIENYPVGGLFYVSANMGSESQVKEMLSGVQEFSQDRIGLPLFLGIQEEGGTVSPFTGNSSFSLKVDGAATLGESGDTDTIYESGKTIGSYMSKLGFNFNIGPVADITKDSKSLTKDRAFGSDAETVASQVAAEVQGMKEEGVSPVLKYFPGKGNVSKDSKSTYATTDLTLDELRESDLNVYKSGIEAGADCVMVGHVVAENITGDQTISSLSKEMITDVLRGELDYDGLVMTEALNSESVINDYTSAEAAVALIQAGGDIIFMPENFEEAYNGVLSAVNDGTITESRIDDSVRRVLRVKLADN